MSPLASAALPCWAAYTVELSKSNPPVTSQGVDPPCGTDTSPGPCSWLKSKPTCSTNTPLRHEDRQDQSSPPRTLIPGWSVLCFGRPGRAGHKPRAPSYAVRYGGPTSSRRLRRLPGGPAFIAFLTVLSDWRDDSAPCPSWRISDLEAAAYSHRQLRVAEAGALQRVQLAGANQRFDRSGAGDGFDVPRSDRLAAG